MVDSIMWYINDIISTVTTLGSTSSSSMLTQTPATFNAAIYNGVQAISQNAVMPVVYVFLGFIFTMALLELTTRTEAMHSSGFEIPFRLLFRLAIAKIAVDSTPLIMGAIFEVSNQVLLNIGSTFASGGVTEFGDREAMREALEDMDFSVKLMTFVQVFIIWIIFKFSTLAIYLTIIGRMVYIYLMTAIAGIPMATLANPNFSSIGKNFIKSYFAACLQGVLIYIVLTMYGTFVSSLSDSFDATNISAVLFQALLYSLVLVMAVFSTGKLSKSICNAM